MPNLSLEKVEKEENETNSTFCTHNNGVRSTRVISSNCGRFAGKSIRPMVNLLLRDVILVNLGFHMCSHCLSMLIPQA